MRSFLLTLTLLAAAGCSNTNSNNGETACGEFTTCTAGRYCIDEVFGFCETGCLSNENCADDQVCDLDDASPGMCVNLEGTPIDTEEPTDGPGDSSDYLSDCQDACGDFSFFCEDEVTLFETELTACAQACADGSPAERQELITCADLPIAECNVVTACW